MSDTLNLGRQLRLPYEAVTETIAHLRSVADYFFDAAHRSEQRTDRKLPD
jgi:hypothetical protein